jgi:hypothetical protein
MMREKREIILVLDEVLRYELASSQILYSSIAFITAQKFIRRSGKYRLHISSSLCRALLLVRSSA